MLSVGDGGFGRREKTTLSHRESFYTLDLPLATTLAASAVSPGADAQRQARFGEPLASPRQDGYLQPGQKQLRIKKKKSSSQRRHRGGKNSIVGRGTVTRNTFGWK